MTNGLAKEFEKLVKQILTKNKFDVEETENVWYDYKIKLNLTSAFVEVKLYRSKIPKIELLKNACINLRPLSINPGLLILIVSSYVTSTLKHKIKEEYGVIVWDIKDLFGLAFDFPDLYFKLDNILVNAFNEPLGDLLIVDENNRKEIKSPFESEDNGSNANFVDDPISNTESNTTLIKSKTLCDDLKSIKKGKTQAVNFEEKCIDILKYLFDNGTDLALFEKQRSTDGRLYRYDLLCRVIASNGSGFWAELAHDFHTRYVVFEFKNYSKEISQEQIFTTEKYLFLSALRSVCFMITREGADRNAQIVAKGALRETGKLIVILTMNDLCKMINLKEKGDEPADVLREKIDNMLITITR